MVKLIRNTSIMTALLVGFLLASQLHAQEVTPDEAFDPTALQLQYQPVEERSDPDSVSLSHQEDDDEGRRPRGFLAALFGYPDEFEGSVPAASQAKSVSVEAPAMFRGSASGRGSMGIKRLPSMVKAVSVSAPKESTTVKGAMDPKTTTTTTEAAETEEATDDTTTAAPSTTEEVTEDAEEVTVESGTEAENSTVEEKSFNGNGTGNATEGASGQKREASPTGGSRGPRGPLPFGGPGRPLPAGYILWHPVPAPFFGGPDVPEHQLASQDSPAVLPPHGGPRGPPPPFMPHRPMFVEPFSGPFPNPGPFPITQFSSPPVFAISPDEAKGGRGSKGRKKSKGGKGKNRPKGRPSNDEEEQPGFQDERGFAGPRPVRVLLPPIPPHGFHGGPNFGFGGPDQQQFAGNEGGPFRGGPPFGGPQNLEQGGRQPPFDQQKAPQNVNADLRSPAKDNSHKNNDNNLNGNLNNNNGFRGPANNNAGGNDNFRGNDFRGPPPNGNFGGPGGNFGVPNGNFGGPGGNFNGPNGNFGGPNGNFGGPGINFNNPNGNFNGPNGNFNGPNGNFGGPNGNFNGPNGNFNGPNGNFNGPNGNFGGPGGNFNGPNGNFNGPNGNFGGLNGNFNGPNDNFDGPRNQKQRRPSPSPSAHPAKFEIDHQKQMQAEFEGTQEAKHGPHNVPPAPFVPPIVPPPIPSPASFPLPNFPTPDPFRFSSTLPPFSFSSPPPQFLDHGFPGGPGGPDFLSHPLPPPPSRSHQAGFTTAAPAPKPSGHSVPASPPTGRFPDDSRDLFPSSTPQSLTDAESSEDGLIYTRDFKKQVEEVKPTTQGQFPVFSSASRQPVGQLQQQHFGQQQRVQRFPAVQQGQSSFPRIPSDTSFGSRPDSSPQSSRGFDDGSKDDRRKNFGGDSQGSRDSGSFQSFGDGSQDDRRNSQDDRRNSNSFRENSPGGSRSSGQRRRKPSNRNRANRPGRLPNTHPNLPDFKTELSPTEPQTLSSTLQPIHESSTAASFSVPVDNYASPGFHTGHKGFPSSVTIPSFDGAGQSTTPSPRVRTAFKSGDHSSAATKSAGPNYYGSTFRTSFTSSPAAGSKNGAGSVDYHYEIQYQSPVPAVATYTTEKPASWSPKKSDASVPFGAASSPEYAASVYQPAQAQGGAYKPGTSRILLEMGEWSNSGRDEAVVAQETHPYLQPSQ